MARLPITNRRHRHMRRMRIISAMLLAFTVVLLMWCKLASLYLSRLRRPIKSKAEKDSDEQDASMDLSSDDENEQHGDSVTQPIPEASNTRTSSKRKKKSTSASGSKRPRTVATASNVESQFHQLASKVHSLVAGLATNFTTMASVMKNEDTREQEAKDRPTYLANELMSLGISPSDIYRVGPMMLKEKSLLEFFFTLPPEARKQYVLDLLSGPSNS